jgi:hypothetical protein
MSHISKNGAATSRTSGRTECQPVNDTASQARRDQHGSIETHQVRTCTAFAVAGGLPFQQSRIRPVNSHHRAHDGIQTDERFVRKKHQRQQTLSQRTNPSQPERHQMRSSTGRSGRFSGQIHQSRQQRRQRHHADNEAVAESPSMEAGPKSHASSSTASIETGTRLRRRLSRIFQRDNAEIGFSTRPDERLANSRHQPGRNLPVAAHPAMSSANVRRVTGRIIFVQNNICQQSRATVAAFQQVVTQNSVLRKVSAASIKHIDVVNAFADERAFGKQILIHIRDDSRVRIDAGIATQTVAQTTIDMHSAD